MTRSARHRSANIDFLSHLSFAVQPLALTASSLVTCLGAGRAENVAALRARRTGLAPCAFETVTLDTCVGEVRGVDQVRVADRLRHFDGRNIRLAQLGLETDGLWSAVVAARERHGADRIGVFLATSTSGILDTELAYRRRDAAGRLPPDFHYRETHNTYSLADYALFERYDQTELRTAEPLASTNLALQYDLHHAQRTQGNLGEFLENYLPMIGHV